MINLCYSLMGSAYAGDQRHAQEVMESLGITYQIAVPQSLYDSWWFFNCENIPADLPEWITIFNAELEDCIGHGLTAEDVKDLRSGHERVIEPSEKPEENSVTLYFKKGQVIPKRLRMVSASDEKARHAVTFGSDVKINGRTVTLLPGTDGCAFFVSNNGRRMNNGTYRKVYFTFRNINFVRDVEYDTSPKNGWIAL